MKSSASAVPKSDKRILALHARETSWVEIVDSQGERLFYALLGEKQDTVLMGKAPFRVVLGNPRGVALEYNGNRFDHSAFYREGRVARFYIGE
ncbi:MAG: DUF4115 domain-containing protein [Gammaproteobacteria bacterium]